MPRFYFDRFDAVLPEWFRQWRDRRIVNGHYMNRYKRPINWDHPTRFSEKIQIVKTSPQYDEYYIYIDKYLVRDYVKKSLVQST